MDRARGAAPVTVSVHSDSELNAAGIGSLLLRRPGQVLLAAGDQPVEVAIIDLASPSVAFAGRAGWARGGLLPHDARPDTRYDTRRDTRRDDGAAVAAALGCGFRVPLSVSADDLVATLRRAREVGVATPGSTGSAGSATPAHDGVLTARESDAVQRICRGPTDEEIVGELHVSTNPVETYIRSAHRKTG